MFYDDPNDGKINPDDSIGQKGGQTGAEDNLGDLGEGLGEGMDITTEDEVQDMEEETS